MTKYQRLICFLIMILMLCIADGLASEIVIEDCGACAGHVISGCDAVKVVSGTHDITLHKVIIDAADKSGTAAFMICPEAEVQLTLEEENILVSGEYCAGLQVPQGAKLMITEKSCGSLTAWSGTGGAGIGGGYEENSGEIVIMGGTIIAKAKQDDVYSNGGAGIGGGHLGNCGDITIQNGEVYAEGEMGGIGGYNLIGNIVINDGIVYAIGGESGSEIDTAAIGSAENSSGGGIAINGGTVYARNRGSFAFGCNEGTIAFAGGRVYAQGDILCDAEGSYLIVTDGVVTVLNHYIKDGIILDRTDGE